MSRADGGGFKQQRARHAVAEPVQVSNDFGQPEPNVPAHVLKGHDRGLTLVDGVGDVRPQVAGIVGSAPLAGDAEWLARVARSEAIHESTPASAVEGAQIRPQRRRIQDARFHALRQDAGGEAVPFNPTECARLSQTQFAGGEFDAEVEPSSAGAEAEDVPGT